MESSSTRISVQTFGPLRLDSILPIPAAGPIGRLLNSIEGKAVVKYSSLTTIYEIREEVENGVSDGLFYPPDIFPLSAPAKRFRFERHVKT